MRERRIVIAMKLWHKIIHLFVFAAILTAGISPACAIISGKTLAEICGADGSVKVVEVPGELAAYFPGAADEERDSGGSEHTALEQQCLFCFAGSHMKPVAAGSQRLALPYFSPDAPFANVFVSADSLSRHAFEARGPPGFLV